MDARRLLAPVSLVLVLAGGCSLNTSASRSTSSAELRADEVAELKEHIVALERRAAMVEVEVRRLRKRLNELEGGSPPAATTTAGPESPDGGMREVEAPSAPVPQARVEVSDLEPEVESSEPPRVETAPAGPVAGAVDGELEEPVVRSDGQDALSASAQALYDRGYTLFHQGRYVDSETAFQQFLQRFGATVLGDNAQFWIAESRYARGDVNGALAAFRETVTRFPGGNKASDAGLKIGDCLRDLGDREGARKSYREVIEGHPSSAAAAIAEERLAALR